MIIVRPQSTAPPPEPEPVDAQVTIRLTKTEKATLRARAKRLNSSMSAEGRAAIVARITT